ncbi:uncharacterized protein LOC112343642 isoform X1 [Selaginella moellendorffii]|uniref:uncharacterized protein LOC112343642 isoform X1 n=1 Tax=Selaginella moellendorffii TaxID=88036 RepID=UPI000D1C5419|nr:uncharacterized protein LOC112343642 isoform X1 [Selaginella moellendorffii]|eukprot:XP_024523192.1 uncharacterized protein LOC112343642 isoform X1 [Selaginella moellendorffii]
MTGSSGTRSSCKGFVMPRRGSSVSTLGGQDGSKMFILLSGCIHDMRVFRNSTLRNTIVARELLTLPAVLAYDDRIKPYLVGDKGYQLQQHLMIPHTTLNPTPSKAAFNLHHHLAWIVIEQAFGLLKMKFRCLDQKQRIQPKYLPNIIKSCCILHNFLIDVGETDLRVEIQAWRKEVKRLKDQDLFVDYGDPEQAEGEPREELHSPEDAKEVRENLTFSLCLCQWRSCLL